MHPSFSIAYERGLESLTGKPYDAVVEVLRAELPEVWLDRYHCMCSGPTNMLITTVEGFDYMFDYQSDLLPPASHEDRVVVAFGRSRAARKARPNSRIRGFPGSDDRGDRGHLMAHSAGGGSDINLFHQNSALNQGKSPEGKRYRSMERYAARHAGTFFFSRPIYTDATARPTEIEFGVLRHDLAFWIEVFENR